MRVYQIKIICLCVIVSLCFCGFTIFASGSEPLGSSSGDESTSPDADEVSDEPADKYINVALPLEVPFCIDPYDLTGLGQIHSERFSVTNLGDCDAIVTFDSVQYIFADGSECISVSDPEAEEFTGEESREKAFYMTLNIYDGEEAMQTIITDQKQSDIASFYLSATGPASNEEEAEFIEGGSIYFDFSGAVNARTDKEWLSNDVTVIISYRVELISNEEAEDNPDPIQQQNIVENSEAVENLENSEDPEIMQYPNHSGEDQPDYSQEQILDISSEIEVDIPQVSESSNEEIIPDVSKEATDSLVHE